MSTLATDLRPALEQIRGFMSEHGGDSWKRHHYGGDLDIVLREGREFSSVPWEAWEGEFGELGAERGCFRNAFHLAMEFPAELTYCEGFASKGYLPIHHAWCVTEDGRVVDPTWRPHSEADDPAGWQYLGIPFDFDYVCRVTTAKETYGVLDDFEIYKAPLPEGAVKILQEAR